LIPLKVIPLCDSTGRYDRGFDSGLIGCAGVESVV